MKLIQYFFCLFFSLFIYLSASAQQYQNTIGVRLGTTNGVSFQHFINKSDAIEIIAGSRWDGFYLTSLYERHQQISELSRLQLYYGAGGHVGSWRSYNNHPFFDDNRDKDYFVIGVDGIIGLAYSFKEAPFTISADWKPELNLTGYSGVWLGEGGLSIRYYW